jgi:Protein of unknown function (DUF5131)
MVNRSAIEWTEVTWNPTTGCDRISPGCDHCYALTLARRLKAMGQPKYQNDGDPRTSGPGFGITVHASALSLPYTWPGRRVVFVNSMSDLSGGVTILVSSFPQLRGHAQPSLCLRHMSRTGTGASLLSACRSEECGSSRSRKPGSASPITGLAAGAL